MEPETGLPPSNRLADHHPEPFLTAYREADSNEERAEVRKKLKRIDSGRWYEVLDNAHDHLARADLSARDNLDELYSQKFKYWIAVFGMCEDLNTFPEFTGVEK